MNPTPERIAEIRQLAVNWPTPCPPVPQALRDLLTAYDTREDQVKQVLLGLLIAPGQGAPDAKSLALAAARGEINARIHAAASALHIDLTT